MDTSAQVIFYTSRQEDLRSDSILSRNIHLLIDIHFDEGDAVGLAVLLCQLFEDRCNHMAWTAPNGVKVDNHILV